MTVTLIEAKRNAQTDLDLNVIDEFRKESAILDSLIFDDAVNPSGGGGTLTYGYRRQVTQSPASFRAINTEYVTNEIETAHYTVELKPLGGAFAVDRVISKVGPVASGAIALNLRETIKATRTRFQDEAINGDIAANPLGFDGLDKALAGSDTEFGGDVFASWVADDLTDSGAIHKCLDQLDEFLSLLDGTPTVLVGNKQVMARLRGIVRRSGMYVRDPVEGLVGPNGRPILRESYGGVLLVDAGDKAGSTNQIIPVETRTVDEDPVDGLTDLYAYRVGLDGFHAVSMAGGQLVQTWLPDFSTPGAVKKGEVEMGPVAVALKATKAAAVFRNIKVR